MRQPKTGGNRGAQRLIGSTLRIWRHALVELLMLLPVWLVPAVYAAPPQLQAAWLLTLPLLSLCGVVIAMRIGPMWLRGLAAVLPAAVAALSFSGLNWQGALLLAAAYAAELRGMAAVSPDSKASDTMRYGVGVILYGIGYAVLRRMPDWTPYMALLTVAGALALAILLFTLNRNLLQRETLSSDARAATASARGHNRWFVAAVLAIALAVTAVAGGAIGRVLWNVIRSVLLWLFAGHREPPPAAAAPPPPPPPPALPAGQQGWFGRVLDALFYAVGILVAAGLVFVGLRAVYRNRQAIARAIGRMLARISAFLARSGRIETDRGFVDEETDLFPWKRLERKPKGAWLRRFTGPRAQRWSDMADNGERVRYLYRQWLRRLAAEGYSSPPHLTPEEVRQQAVRTAANGKSPRQRQLRKSNSTDELATAEVHKLIRLYYKARYDRTAITDAELSTVMPKREKPRSR